MIVQYAARYIDGLYEAKDIYTLHQVIRVVGRDRKLPEQFWLFSHLVDWWCMSRSGIWQYYDGIPVNDFERLAHGLERSGLVEVAERYRSGMQTWKPPNLCRELDRWIDLHSLESGMLESAAFSLIANDRDYLCA